MEFVFITDGHITYDFVEDTTLDKAVFDHIAFVSDDITKGYKHLKELSLTTTEIVYCDFLFHNGVKFFFIKDDNNERIEFIQKL